MNILVFDTCFNKTYVVLKCYDKIAANKVIVSDESNYHSVYLIPQIKTILNDNNLKISDIDAFGVNIGPGSFTGIRAGITIARVLCQQFNTKLVGVSSLKILSKLVDDNKCVVALDARKNKVYFAKYSKDNEIISPCLIDKDELVDKISNNTVITDNSIYNFLSEKKISSINYEINDENLGLYLAEIVSKEIKNSNNDFNWASVKPLYIQPPSITKPKVNKNV